MSNHINSSEMEVSIVMGVPPNGWFIMENAVKMDDLLIKPTPPDIKNILTLNRPIHQCQIRDFRGGV
jgi:hypothetical protein